MAKAGDPIEVVRRCAAYSRSLALAGEHLGMIADETNLVIAVKNAMVNLPTTDRSALLDWMSSRLTKNDAHLSHIESEAEGTLVGSIKAAFIELSASEKRSIIDWTR